MFDDIKALKEMQRVQAGGVAKLSKSQIVGGLFNLRDLTKGLDKKTADECIAFFDSMRRHKEKELYDAEKLTAEMESMKRTINEIVTKSNATQIFSETLEMVEDFLLTKPFRGIDDISYGFQEVCVFSAAEYLSWFFLRYKNSAGIQWYKSSMTQRADAETADTLMMYPFESIQDDIAKDANELRNTERPPLDKTNILFHVCAFQAIKKMCLHKCDDEQLSEILDLGDLAYVIRLYDSDGASDGSSFMDNYLRLQNFLIDYYKKIIVPHK